MKLKRAKEFVSQLNEDENIRRQTRELHIFRQFSGLWYGEADEPIADAKIKVALAQTLKSGNPWRRKNDSLAYFPVAQLSAVVQARFNARPSQGTMHKLHELVDDCLERSLNAYNATHDPLTELYNRAALDKFLMENIEACLGGNSVSEEEEGLASTPSIVLISIDLDFFKQINDNFGHVYGDQVLKALAIRLEAICNDLCTQSQDTLRCLCARPGGEEFSALFAGGISPENELLLAEGIRSAISDQPLPSDSEWKTLSDGGALEHSQLPHVSERRVSASLGVSSLRGASSTSNAVALAQRLKLESDAALSRAKVCGRNRSIKYTDILARHGRILEYNTETEVVAVDIGRNVGVAPGQEFFVYHPQFSGERPFVFRDGRTERKLGFYPRVPCGRIEIFDVQGEISFGHIQTKRGVKEFPIGSLLEAIPEGSIGHLIKDEWWRRDTHELPVVGRESINRELKLLASSQDDVIVMVVTLGNKKEVVDSRGLGFVNRAYATLYTTMRQELAARVLAQAGRDNFALIASSCSEEVIQETERVVERIEETLDGIPRFFVGAYWHRRASESEATGDESQTRWSARWTTPCWQQRLGSGRTEGRCNSKGGHHKP